MYDPYFQLWSGTGDESISKRNLTLPLFSPNLSPGTTGLLTHAAEDAASAVAGDACLHVLKIQSVCVHECTLCWSVWVLAKGTVQLRQKGCSLSGSVNISAHLSVCVLSTLNHCGLLFIRVCCCTDWTWVCAAFWLSNWVSRVSTLSWKWRIIYTLLNVVVVVAVCWIH